MSRASVSPARARSTDSAMLAVTEFGDRARKLALKPRGRAEMMEQIGVGAADLRRDRLQGDRRRSLGEQQLARGLERGGPAFFRAQACSSY